MLHKIKVNGVEIMKTLLVVVAIITGLGVVGTMDYQDKLKEAEHYAAMVCDGSWPNYKGIEVDCNEN